MSNFHSSTTSSSYISTSSSSSSTSNDGQTYSKSETTRSSYNDRDGGSSKRVTSETGKPTLVETMEIPASGGRVEGTTSGQGRIEDVSDQAGADRRYEDAMEDEYAKREGGA